MAIKEANTTVIVKDIDRSVAFYESIGMQIKNRWGNHYAQMSAPGILIGLHPSENIPGNSGNVSIGFTADDFGAAKTLLEKLSIKITERQEAGGEFLHFEDPDGTGLYFIKPKW